MDSLDIFNSNYFCGTTFQNTLCSPSNILPDLLQQCTCQYVSYIAAGPVLHFIGIILWFILLLVTGLRWFGYKYSGLYNEYEDSSNTPLVKREERIKEIYSSYGY